MGTPAERWVLVQAAIVSDQLCKSAPDKIREQLMKSPKLKAVLAEAGAGCIMWMMKSAG